ncbi:hypothetical protein ILUMI_15125 [Ignelater luminosus]|uniref:Uncharacterized protein n=1 Tax=Ignelater luminosus TaxID=2038154 RepID=A0A8K0CUP5_IGNLU|nr:hypothetical protein ILUMI_15125 [Ignelater luminosus]
MVEDSCSRKKQIKSRNQQNIMVDNILRNLEVNNRVLERPADFPNLPVSNKTEYRCVEEFLSKDENFTYMKTKMCCAIIDAVKLSYGTSGPYTSDLSDKVIKESIQDWLKLAKSRYTYNLKKDT